MKCGLIIHVLKNYFEIVLLLKNEMKLSLAYCFGIFELEQLFLHVANDIPQCKIEPCESKLALLEHMKVKYYMETVLQQYLCTEGTAYTIFETAVSSSVKKNAR